MTRWYNKPCCFTCSQWDKDAQDRMAATIVLWEREGYNLDTLDGVTEEGGCSEGPAGVNVEITGDATVDLTTDADFRCSSYDLWHKIAMISSVPGQPGDWIESRRFGSCVLIEDRGDHCALRYKAKHLQSQRVIWVGALDGHDACTFIRPADDESRRILRLEGTAPFEDEGSD